jgi:hypothetical protein
VEIQGQEQVLRDVPDVQDERENRGGRMKTALIFMIALLVLTACAEVPETFDSCMKECPSYEETYPSGRADAYCYSECRPLLEAEEVEV